jgi:hypothetical protein
VIKDLLEGIAILSKYYEDPEGHNYTCEHDEFIMFRTQTRVDKEDYLALIDLGWDQPEAGNDDHDYDLYDEEESWVLPSSA